MLGVVAMGAQRGGHSPGLRKVPYSSEDPGPGTEVEGARGMAVKTEGSA